MSEVHWDIRGLLKCQHDPWSSSRASTGDRLLMRSDGNARIPSLTKQGNRPYSRDEEGDLELFLSCGGTISVPLECRRGCRELLELCQVCQGPLLRLVWSHARLVTSRARKAISGFLSG